jgi:WD40 repeat protein
MGADVTLPPFPRPPHPYARRNLAAHAAAAGQLHDVLDLQTLPYLDEARLSTLLRLSEPDPLSEEWLLLSAWRSIRHRWSWDDPDANAAALDVALLAVNPRASLPERWTKSGVAWRPSLVDWQSGGIIVAGDQHRGPVVLAVGTVRGKPLLATADLWSVRLWDPATGQPISDALPAPAAISGVSVAEGPGLVLAVCEGGQVVAWDSVTHRLVATIETVEPEPLTLAVGGIGDRWVLATGGPRGAVQVRWISSGEVAQEIQVKSPVRAVALANGPDARLYIAIGYDHDENGRISVYEALSGALPHDVIPVDGKITSLALARVGRKRSRSAQNGVDLVVAAGTTRGAAEVWDALGGSRVSSMNHGAEVRSVALTSILGTYLLATGGADRRVRIWDAFSGAEAGQPLRHPSPLTVVAFGDVEGRTKVVTGSLDGNIRLWDPLQSRASGEPDRLPRLSPDGWFSAVALDEDVVAASGEDGQIRVWNLGYGGFAVYSPPPAEPEYPSARRTAVPPVVRLRLAGGRRGRTLVAQNADRVRVWHLDDPSLPFFRADAVMPDLRDLDVYVAADSGQVLVAGLEKETFVTVTDLVTQTPIFASRVKGAQAVRFINAPGRPLLGVGTPDELLLLDVESGGRLDARLAMTLPEHASVGRLDEMRILAALDSDGLRLFDLATGEQTIAPIEMSTTASGVAWGRVDDRDVLVTAHFATVRVWNPRTGRKITELRLGTRIGGMSVRDDEDGKLMVAISGPGLLLTELRAIPQLLPVPAFAEP